ncbi:RHS repeat-associated core domain-containing protein [candidate division WOR-3 bacterium]|nr:RHS repeat-associated core domain-containing protein [candidate division WOR-3 bacterium]
MNKKEIHSPLVITKDWIIPSIAKEYKYKAFGEMKYESGTYDNTHKFTGKEEDGTGLYYYGARYYDKSIGRWISPDPASYPSDLRLNDPQSFNPYVYCRNNPLNYLDPDGERSYFVNGIHYDLETNDYGKAFVSRMTETGIQNPRQLSAVYLRGFPWDLASAYKEKGGKDVYHGRLGEEIERNLKVMILGKGEQVNIIGYSGGGYIALNIAEDRISEGQKVDNVIIVAAPGINENTEKVKELKQKGVNVIFSKCGHEEFLKNEGQEKVIREMKEKDVR